MKKIASVFLIFIFAQSLSYGQAFFEKADSFFGKYVKDGRVNYSAIKQNPEKLNMLVSKISSYSLEEKGKNEEKAFYINAYNILVIKGIIDNYPIKSPLDKEGFFDKVKYNVSGEMLTLNEIENEKLRAEFDDPRIHFVLVCAAIGCPELISNGYFPESLDKQIEQRTIATLKDPDFIRVKNDKVEISEIFKWYSVDFGGRQNYRTFLNKFRKDNLPSDASIDFYSYDWALNEKK